MKQVWVVALLLIPMAYAAATVNTSETNIIMEDGIANVKSNMLLSLDDATSNLTLILTPNPISVEIIIDGQKTDCLLQADFARCGRLTTGEHTVNISYETDYPIAQVGENTLFRYTDKLPYPANEQQVSLTLPVGYIIPREKDKDETFYTSPKPKDVYSDGQRIILYWEQKGQEFPISVIARKVIGPPFGWIASTIALVLITAAGVAWFILTQRKAPKPKQAKKKQVIVPTLMDNEQKIVEFLKQNGEVWQKQILAATGFSKAKVSRILRNLEERGVITKTIYGNTNKIALKK